MFGLCVLNRCAIAFCSLFLFWGVDSFAAAAQDATVITDGALVYQNSDFDSPVITTLKLGSHYRVSTGKKGAFHKIRIKKGMVGWVADTDIKPGIIKIAKPKEEVKEKPRRRRQFYATRYRGPVFEYLQYTEDTLGGEQMSPTMFYGIKFNGYDTVFSGEIYADANLMFHFGAPDFYSEKTGKTADGYIVMLNFLLQTALPQSKTHMVFYGFGPMFKYSHYAIDVPNGASTLTYSADDMVLGAVFNLGLGFRIGDMMSLRTDLKYYWERTQYYGLGMNFGFEF